MKVLFVGDIVGASGRRALRENLPVLKQTHRPDFILVNGENAAGGKGITRAIANEFFDLGVHAITMGNHTWDNKEIFDFIDHETRLIRPANYPVGTPGRGTVTIKSGSKELMVINLMGRTFMPPLDCPFQTLESMLANKKTKAVIVDLHAEATSEKLAMAWYMDGQVSAVLGTHTHVQTNDEQIMPKGTAYVTDVGMTGSREGILGMERESIIRKFRTQLPSRFVADDGKYQFHAVLLEINETTGRSHSIRLIRLYEDEFRMS
jgi:metallophosphoesterase (TIGR00282 family)